MSGLPKDGTIAAIATGGGSGGVGIVRISGDEAVRILSRLTRRKAETIESRRVYHGHVYEGEENLDEVLFFAMRAPASFTGEDVAEIHGHGGVANLGRILRAVLAEGARPAEAGEFTRRAFSNGRLDLTRAEAIADIVNAASERALRVAQGQLRGALGEKVASLLESATVLLAEVTANIDFPEENLDEIARDGQVQRVRALEGEVRKLAASFGMGKALQSGLDIVLRGPVNAGKSSLFNALLGEERALVSEEEGTTRDFVEASAVWDGVVVTLVDTAGLRSAEGVESRGIELGKARADRADFEIVVSEEDPVPVSAGGSGRELHVRSKCDQIDAQSREAGVLYTSSRTGEGLDALRTEILRRAVGQAGEGDEGLVVSSERQRDRLLEASQALARGAELLSQDAPTELVAIEFDGARQSLLHITGENADDGVLDELFARFCIGK